MMTSQHCTGPRCPATAGCFGSSLIGVLLVTRAVRRSGKASALVLILAGVIGLGAVLTGALALAPSAPVPSLYAEATAAQEVQAPRSAELERLHKHERLLFSGCRLDDVVPTFRGFRRAQSH